MTLLRAARAGASPPMACAEVLGRYGLEEGIARSG